MLYCDSFALYFEKKRWFNVTVWYWFFFSGVAVMCPLLLITSLLLATFHCKTTNNSPHKNTPVLSHQETPRVKHDSILNTKVHLGKFMKLKLIGLQERRCLTWPGAAQPPGCWSRLWRWFHRTVCCRSVGDKKVSLVITCTNWIRINQM